MDSFGWAHLREDVGVTRLSIRETTVILKSWKTKGGFRRVRLGIR